MIAPSASCLPGYPLGAERAELKVWTGFANTSN